MRMEHYSTGLRPAENASKKNIFLVVGRFVAAAAECVRLWFSDWRKARRDAAILSAMSDHELKDIGLYRRDLPQNEVLGNSASPERWRLKDNVIMVDGAPFSESLRKTPI